MPGIMMSLGTDFATVQLVLSVYLFATAIAQLVLGPLSDRFGRRPVLLAGLLIFVVASVICTFAPTIEVLLFGRVLQGIGGCAGIVIGRAIVRDRYDRDQAAVTLAYVTMGYAVAPMIGPVIGGIIDDHLGWRANFGLVLILGVLTTIVAWRFLPETRVRDLAANRAVSLLGGFAQLARVPAFWAFTLAGSFASTAFFVFLGAAPFISSRLLGLSGTAFGFYFLFLSFGYIIGTFLTGRYAARYGIVLLIVIGGIIQVLSGIAVVTVVRAGWITPLGIFLPIYVSGFSNGLVIPNAVAGAVSVRPHLAGAAAGLNGSVQILLGALATMFVAKATDYIPTAMPMAIGVLAFSILSLIAGIWTRTARG
jgi:DHA1 family bicyclomycin/chloramphenicol resistance-like MFS transporter